MLPLDDVGLMLDYVVRYTHLRYQELEAYTLNDEKILDSGKFHTSN